MNASNIDDRAGEEVTVLLDNGKTLVGINRGMDTNTGKVLIGMWWVRLSQISAWAPGSIAHEVVGR